MKAGTSIMLISLDVGDTLGRFERPGAADLLAELSPMSRSAITEYDRQFLHPIPKLTEEVISKVCRMLAIPRENWRLLGSPGGFHAFDYTVDVLAELVELGPVVALSNVSIIAGPNRMREVREQCSRRLGAIYTSGRLETRKPDKECWERIAEDHYVDIDEIVHIGDRLTEDIRGPLFAGCRGAILTNTRGEDVPADLLEDPRVTVVDDLRGVIPVLQGWSQAL